MLQSFSDRIRNSRWLGYGIVIAIAIPFALLGIEAYLGNGGNDVAAEVNGTPIQSVQLQQQVSQRRAQLREQFGGNFPEMLSEGLRERVLDQLILREVLRQAASDARMRVSSQTLAARIRQLEPFRQNGQFNRELYRQVLSHWGLSPEQYEAQMRSAFGVEQLRDGITNTAFALAGEGRQGARLARQERQVVVLEFPRAQAAERVAISPEQIQAFYDEHRDRFQTPPRVRVAYLELSIAALAQEVDVSEQELRAEYRRQQEGRAQSGERHAAHILIEVPENAGEQEVQAAREQAEQLRQRLVEGEADFAELAREHSDDPGSARQGGDLGFVGRGTMVAPFEEALFGLEEPGAISEPVRTGFGFHVIQLVEVRGESAGATFAEARDEIERQLRRRKADRLFRERGELLRNTAYENPGSLEPAAEATGLEVEHSDWFSRREGEGIAEAPAVREAAFQPDIREQGVNSDLLELGNGRLAVVRVVGEQPAEPKPLDSVRDEVRQQLREQRIEALLTEWSDTAIARLQEGAGPSQVAEAEARTRDLGWIRRDGDAPPRIATAAFELPSPEGENPEHRAVWLESGDRAVVVVRRSRLPDVDEDAVEQARTERRRGLARAEMEAWAEALRSAAEITRSP